MLPPRGGYIARLMAGTFPNPCITGMAYTPPIKLELCLRGFYSPVKLMLFCVTLVMTFGMWVIPLRRKG
jgi:hypothetical protein